MGLIYLDNTLKSKLKEIDDYFDSLSIEEFEEVLIRNGMQPVERLNLLKKVVIKIRRWFKWN